MPSIGFLPQVLLPHFRDGEVELVTQSIFQTLKNLPFLLERMAVGNEQFDRADTQRSCPLALCQQTLPTGRYELRRNLVDSIGLDDIAGFHIIEVLDPSMPHS